MEPTPVVPGEFLYLTWNIETRLIGPFVRHGGRRAGAQRSEPLTRLRQWAARLAEIPGIGRVRLFQSTVIIPLPSSPRFDLAMILDGTPEAVEQVRSALPASQLPEPVQVSTAHNTVRFGQTDDLDGPILLNHFVSETPAAQLAEVWAGISGWYSSALGVTNSTLLSFDTGSPESAPPQAVMNYASVPGPVARFMLGQVLRPSFRHEVLAPLDSVGARALPVFARRAD